MQSDSNPAVKANRRRLGAILQNGDRNSPAWDPRFSEEDPMQLVQLLEGIEVSVEAPGSRAL